MANIYITIPGDQWDVIAKKVYGDELKADHLMRHNLHLLDIYEFDAGVEISVPVLPSAQRDSLPPWRRMSA